MSRPPQVTYPIFAETAHQLIQAGQRVSVRAVRAQIGGSPNQLLLFLRQWQAEQRAAAQVEEPLSEACRQAILAEIGQAVQKTRDQLADQLSEEKSNTQEALEIVTELEKKQTEQTAALAQCQTDHQDTVLAFEKQIAGLKARLADQQQRERQLITQLEALRADLHQAEIAAAVVQARYEALAAQPPLSEQEKDEAVPIVATTEQ